jgi:hypothetical protein
VEPAACQKANLTGLLRIDKKKYKVQEGAIGTYTDFTEGSLIFDHNCQVGTLLHGVITLDCQVTQTVMEVSYWQEWARMNEVSRMITTTSRLIAPMTDLSMMDTDNGMYVWEYSQKHCPDSIVQLYVDKSKVLTNSSTSFTGGLAIMEGSEKNQVVTLELMETLLLCQR